MKFTNRQRYRLLVLLIVALGVAVGGALLSRGSTAHAGQTPLRPQLAPNLRDGAGFSAITGMSKIISGSLPVCSEKGSEPLPSHCAMKATGGVDQGWVLTPATTHFGALGHGLKLPIPLAFAKAHPGPAEVFDRVLTLPTQSEAEVLLKSPDYVGSSDKGYVAMPSAAFDGGVAARIDSEANGGLSEYRFDWVRGTSILEVNVLGSGLSVGQAKQVATSAVPG